MLRYYIKVKSQEYMPLLKTLGGHYMILQVRQPVKIKLLSTTVKHLIVHRTYVSLDVIVMY